jgi:hypothetical protein
MISIFAASRLDWLVDTGHIFAHLEDIGITIYMILPTNIHAMTARRRSAMRIVASE